MFSLVVPVLKCMHCLLTVCTFILNASFFIGRTIILILLQTCTIIRDILTTLYIIGEELHRFVCELNESIGAVTTYLSSSANGSINCVLDAVGIFIKHIANFFVKTRLHSKLLATHIGGFLKDSLHLFRNALLLLADCAWWLITLLPKWVICAIILVGDYLVETITHFRGALVYTAHVIVDDVFRLTIGIVILFLLWHNHRRLSRTTFRWIIKFIRLCCLCITMLTRRIFGRVVNRTVRKRPPLIRSSVSPREGDNTLDYTQLCVICKDRQKCVLLLPCKHLCVCEECADKLLLTSMKQCPLCRKFISNLISVYI